MSLAPSLFDLQINGYAGVDFQNPALTHADLRRAIDALRAGQTHRILLTFITDELETLAGKFAQIEKYRAADAVLAETICGYHLEGPFLSPEEGYRGAHPGECMRAPDLAAFRRLQDAAGGNIRLLTLAPEWPGSPDFISAVSGQGVVISLGHTNASEEQIDAAIRAGATMITHLGNGTPVTLPRHNNVIQRLLARDELTACLIPDGAHLPPFTVRNFFRAKPRGKVLFTTDAMAAAGAAPGLYRIGRLEVESRDGFVRAPGSANLAGSCLAPAQGVANAAQWLGIPVAEARAMFSTGVAAHFGICLPEIEIPGK
ncbi:MAG: N-acetylglucosamine-6-phosphate deacetylase [Chthoniobacter sp.]|nr:N-acetylglucosamine-6-phosphate deacetylase [Chthoniobacter sp.]